MADGAAEHVQCTDRVLTQSYRKCVHRPEPGGHRVAGEGRPPFIVLGQMSVDDRRASAECVHAWTALFLSLKQLQHLHGLIGRGHELQPPVPVGEEESFLDTIAILSDDLPPALSRR
jgi:hypothetical protein